MSRVLDYDPLTGITMTFRYDHISDNAVIGYTQDCTDIIEGNKRAVIEADHARQMANDMIHYARIPVIVQYEWLYKHKVDFGKREDTRKWMALLNSPDYKYLKRTTITHDR